MEINVTVRYLTKKEEVQIFVILSSDLYDFKQRKEQRSPW